MPELLTHALIAYSVSALLSWRYEWIRAPYRTAAMAGAFIPDLSKTHLLVSEWWIESILGIPYQWTAVHTAGGVLLSVLIGTLLVVKGERRRVFALLSLGAATHLIADLFLMTPSGESYAVLWPLSGYYPPAPGLYLSTQPEPTVVAIVIAVVVHFVTVRRSNHNDR